MVTPKEYAKVFSDGEMDEIELAPESVAHMYGYTVNQQTGLTPAQRHTILSFLIDNHIQTVGELMHLLETNIRLKKNRSNMQEAISRWEDDLDFLVNYESPVATVRVDRIFERR